MAFSYHILPRQRPVPSPPPSPLDDDDDDDDDKMEEGEIPWSYKDALQWLLGSLFKFAFYVWVLLQTRGQSGVLVRVIQCFFICIIIIWGIFVLYFIHKLNPASERKTMPAAVAQHPEDVTSAMRGDEHIGRVAN